MTRFDEAGTQVSVDSPTPVQDTSSILIGHVREIRAEAHIAQADTTHKPAHAATAADTAKGHTGTDKTGTDKSSTNRDVQKILGDFSIEGPKADTSHVHKTQDMVNALHKDIYKDADAALVAVASRLASDPDLAHKVTDSSGRITKKSIDEARLIDKGLQIHQTGSHPEPRLFNDQERKEIKFIADNNRVLGDAGIAAAGVVAGANVGTLSKILKDNPNVTPEQFKKISAEQIRAALEGMAVGQVVGGVLAGAGLEAAKAAGKDHTKPGATHVRATDQAQISDDQFVDVAKRVLTKLDKDHDGKITKDMLAKALQDPSFKGDEVQALVALYQNFDKLHNLSHHENIWNTASINAADLEKYRQISHDQSQLTSDSSEMKQWGHTSLRRFSHDGEHLNRDDIEKALKNPSTSAGDRHTLELIKKHYGEMDSVFNFSGLTAGDMDKFDEHAWKNSASEITSGVYGSTYTVSQYAQKAGTSYDLYAGNNPRKAINPEAVQQGAIGDCYYEAVVAGLAKSNPALIQSMIKDNHNGTYTVTFPGDKNHPVTVKAPTEAELGLYNRGSSYGTWASVLEKAYGQYRDSNAWFFHSNTPQEGADGGGFPEPVIRLFTGHESNSFNVGSVSQAEMAKRLQDAVAAHKAIATGIDADFLSIIGLGSEKTANNFYKQHEYTITGFEPDGKGGGMVVIRNPWGLTKGTPEGTIKIPLSEFMKNFSDVAIEK